MPHSVQPDSPENYTLVERLEGREGKAVRWAYTPALDPTTAPCAPTFWLIYLPEYDGSATDPDEPGGVFHVHWLNHDHEAWARFRDTLPRFRGKFSVHVAEVWGSKVSIENPAEYDEVDESTLQDNGDRRESADHLMRLWVEEILAGNLDPYEGASNAPDPEAYFADLRARADATSWGA